MPRGPFDKFRRRSSLATQGNTSNLLEDTTGLKTVYPHGYDSNNSVCNIDVILVHGLNGGNMRTWTKGNFYWPTQLLPRTLPKARIMTFGYNVNLTELCAEGRIRMFAETLYSAIDICRRTAQERLRPVLFICHSMGGLVAKKCVSIAHYKNPSMSLLNHGRTGFIFLATPHRGANTAILAEVLSKIVKVARFGGVRSDAPKELRALSDTCLDIHTEFVGLSSRLGFTCISFYEHRGYGSLGVIVKQESAHMGIESELYCVGLDANHRDICRFSSSTDEAYKQFQLYIIRIVQELGMEALDQSLPTPSPDRDTLTYTEIDEDGVSATDGKSVDEDKDMEKSHVPNPSDSVTTMAIPTPMSIGPADEKTEHPMAPTTAVRSRDEGVTNDLPLFRPQHFFGRRSVLERMEAHFQDKTNYEDHAFGLYGQIGVGKSYLALQFMHQNKRQFNYRFWVYADTAERIKKSMDDIAHQIGISTATHLLEPEHATNAIKSWLQRNPGWLLVFDNVEDINQILPYWPREYHLDSYIIMTSRDHRTTRQMTAHFKLECFTEAEGTEWFWSIIASEDRDPGERPLATEIVKLLGGLPLALDYVATSISACDQSLEDFLAEYRSDDLLALEYLRGANFSNNQDMRTAYDEYLSKLPAEADDLMDIISLLAPDSIPVELFSHFERYAAAANTQQQTPSEDNGDDSATSTTTLSPVLSRDGKLKRAIKTLTLKSLLQRAKQDPAAALTTSLSSSTGGVAPLRVQRVAQAAMRSRLQLQPERQHRAFSNALFCICESFPRHVFLGNTMVDLYPECAKFAEHLLSILDYYERNKAMAKLAVNNTFAEVLAHCGWYFFERGVTDSALRVLHAAEAMCAPNSATSGLVYNNLGAVYMLRREEHKALGYTKRAIKDRKHSISPGDSEIQQLAFSYMNYANDLQLVPPVDRAGCAELYEMALEIGENGPGRTPHTRQLILCNTAFAYYRWGELDKALYYIVQAIALHRDCGAHTTFTLYGLYYYGNIKWACGERLAAYNIHLECLKQRQKLQSDAHYTTGVSFHKTGRLAYELGRPIEAIDYLTEAEMTFRDYHDDPGLWPRTCIFLGRVMIEMAGDRNDEDMLAKGRDMREQGLKAARKLRPGIGDGSDDKVLDSLVREVYR